MTRKCTGWNYELSKFEYLLQIYKAASHKTYRPVNRAQNTLSVSSAERYGPAFHKKGVSGYDTK